MVEVEHRREAIVTRNAGSSAAETGVNWVTRNIKGSAESEVTFSAASQAAAYCFVASQIPASRPASSIRRIGLNSIKRHRHLAARLEEG